MGSPSKRSLKRKNLAVEEAQDAKKARASSEELETTENHEQEETAGRIRRMVLRNIMCHDHMEVDFNENVNFIVGKNGSGKSAILTGLTVGFGARATTTSRADSLQSLIKTGSLKGSVEITITNVGPLAYKPDVYGNSITVLRTLGNTSQYSIKSASGRVISKRKHELDQIVTSMNIQVDNPISILNQDAAKEFLRDANPLKKYKLFMKATQLEVIGNHYKEALKTSEEARQLLKTISKQLHTEMQETQKLEEKLNLVRGLDDAKKQLDGLEVELQWSYVNSEEDKLLILENRLKKYTNTLEELQNARQDHGAKVGQMSAELESLQADVDGAENASKTANDVYTQAKNKSSSKREEVNNKIRESKTIKNQLRLWNKEVADLTEEIRRLEGGRSNAEQKRNEHEQRLAKWEAKSKEVNASLRTSQTELTHMEAEKQHLEKLERSTNVELEQQRSKIARMQNQLRDLKQQSDNAFSVFGRNIPRLLKRIGEEFAKGRFREKPCGPMGAFMKIKDQSWIPAIEKLLGPSIFSGFCVDNAQDSKLLGNLMKEVYRDDNTPNIMCSKFHNRVHNVSGRGSGTPEYPSLLDAMEIDNPIVANCLIDQREPECIVLIPTSEEAKRIMSHARNVPRNCIRAITKNGDTFYPDPQYRFYGGRVATRAKWLQVSTKEAIQTLQEELATAENEKNRISMQNREHREKLQRNHQESNLVHQKIMALTGMQRKVSNNIDEMKDTLAAEINDNCDVFKAEKLEKEAKIENDSKKESELKEEIRQLEKEWRDLEDEVRHCREATQGYNEQVIAKKQKIQELANEKKELELNANYSKQKIKDMGETINKATAELEIQRAITEEVIKKAEGAGPKVQTKKPPKEIKRKIEALEIQIGTVEGQCGSREELENELEEKRNKTHDVVEFLTALRNVNDQHSKRVDERRKEYHKLKRKMGHNVKQAFSNVLSLRNYKGTITIDHSNKTLELEVLPQNSERRGGNNDVQTLSGGERSYSTVAFILALWECTTLPFYFMDEFDVFMDKVNRRIILDVLMMHTNEHPERQFGFLTPLDASTIKASNYVTIHKLAQPERSGGTQQQ